MKMDLEELTRLTREYTHHQAAADSALAELQASLLAWMDRQADPERAWDWLQSQPFETIGYRFPPEALAGCLAWIVMRADRAAQRKAEV